MTQTFIAQTTTPDSALAGRELGGGIRAAFGGEPADAVIVFASAQHEYETLLRALADAAGTAQVVGSSSAGEFTHDGAAEGRVSALALRSQEMRFAVGLGTGIAADPEQAAGQLLGGFAGITSPAMPYRSALVMTDALAGHADRLVESLTVRTAGNYRFFGGGAGDDGRFQTTHVFAQGRAYTNAVVALEILSRKPVGVGVSHGWRPVGPLLRVTESHGSRLVSLNGAPALEAVARHAQDTEQRFDAADPMPFFLHNVLGIRSEGEWRLRVPLAVHEDGSLACAADVPEGAVVSMMRTSASSAVEAATQATSAALGALGGHRPAAALFFDCVATRLRLGRAFEDEVKAAARLVQPAGLVGCNTYGQIARAEGQFGGFHNCTAVVCVLPA